MSEHTVPPLQVDVPCPSGRPYPHTYDARCEAATPPLMPGGESASARLRRVEQERDQWLAAARSWSDRYAEACRAGHVLQAELGAARIAARRSDDLARSLHAELEQERARRADLATAHRHACTMLAAAAQERDAARVKAAQLYADLAEALDELEQAQAATNDKEKNT